jgi:hypothetical protein
MLNTPQSNTVGPNLNAIFFVAISIIFAAVKNVGEAKFENQVPILPSPKFAIIKAAEYKIKTR